MNGNKHDWSKFSIRIPINSSTDRIYNAMTKQEEIEKWFLSRAEFTMPDKAKRDTGSPIQKGDLYEWNWHGSDFLALGEVLEVNGNDKIKFTFLSCPTTIEIKSEDGENVVELTQKGIPEDEESKVDLHVGCTRGWTFYLANLKSYLEGGVDLRNRNKKLDDVINT